MVMEEVVACVVVTYNRIQMLRKTIEGISKQIWKPDFVIIVDNNSTDGTRLWVSDLALSEKNMTPLLLDKNYGGAGGFYHGIKTAYERGADWIWIMDDDCIPAPEALERLVESALLISGDDDKALGFVASKVNWVDGSRHKMNIPKPAQDWWNHNKAYPMSIKITHASFVSLLLNAEAIKRVGYPVKEFFIWHDDVEFTNRITKGGFVGYSIENSMVTHCTPSNHGPDYSGITTENLWKWKYGARNWVAFRRSNFGLLSSLRLLIRIYLMMKKNRILGKMYFPILYSGLKGLFYNYKKYIVYPKIT